MSNDRDLIYWQSVAEEIGDKVASLVVKNRLALEGVRNDDGAITFSCKVTLCENGGLEVGVSYGKRYKDSITGKVEPGQQHLKIGSES